ncbi:MULTISPECIES: hypothetical protein [Metallosphaera]|uniref:hypothetical protein n=1 Tax=Metallosphaera TaxID=41980 RepID=UPI001E63DC79|nr:MULTISPECIES: hypothetical protein [Metallosphaera]MCY0862319.1 hypothetical protein [Metallosphaera prunae]WPX05380.1 hypothetical protein SOJ17_001351 [Metallosphaera sedula DSM 5348]
MRRLSRTLQELLEEFFRAKDGEELVFEGDQDTLKKLELVLRVLAQETRIEGNRLLVKKRRP